MIMEPELQTVFKILLYKIRYTQLKITGKNKLQ